MAMTPYWKGRRIGFYHGLAWGIVLTLILGFLFILFWTGAYIHI